LIFESTTTGDFPPSSSKTGVRCFAAAVITILPTFPLPNNTVTVYARKYVYNLNETIHLILLLFYAEIMLFKVAGVYIFIKADQLLRKQEQPKSEEKPV